MQTANLLIGGMSVPARNGATFDRIDPFTGAVATRAAAATIEDADAAVAAAHAAFPPGARSRPPSDASAC